MANEKTIPSAIDTSDSLGNDGSFLLDTDVPVASLKADLYAAEDIDGVTEGLSGSGNLNYLIMQTQQTNEASANSDPFDFNTFNDLFGDVPGMAGNGVGPGDNGGAAGAVPGFSADDNEIGFSGYGQQESSDPQFGGGDGTNGNFSANLSTMGASFYDTHGQITEKFGDDGLNGIDGSGNDGIDGAGNDGADGTDGDDGEDGEDGDTPVLPEPPDPPGDADLTLDLDSDILDLDLDGFLDPLENIVGDIDIDIDAALGDILSLDDGIIPNPEIIIDALVGGSPIEPVLDPVLAVVGDTVDTLNGVLDTVLGDVLPGDVMDVISNLLGGGDGDRDLFVDLGTGLPDLGLGGLTFLGSAGLDIPLDPVENLLGDIDLGFDVSAATNALLGGSPTDLPSVMAALITGGDILPNATTTLLNTDDLSGSLGDTLDGVSGILDDGLGDIGGNVTDLTGNLLGGDGLDDALGGLADGDIDGVVDGLTGGLDGLVPTVEDAVTALTDDLLGGADGLGVLTDGLLGGNPAGNDLLGMLGDDGDESGAADTDLDLLGGLDLGVADLGGLDVDAVLDPVENIVGDIDIGLDTGVVDDVGNIVEDIAAGDVDGVVGDIGGAVGGLLDDLTGADIELDLFNPDADQNADLGADLGGTVDGVVDGLGGLGDADNLLGVLDNNPADEAGGADTDLSLDLGVLNTDDLGIDTVLDPVENIVGDIDLGIDADASGIVDDLAAGNIGGINDDLLGTIEDAVNVTDFDIDLLNPDSGQDGALDLGLGGVTDDLLGGDAILGGLGDLGGDELWPEASIGDGLDGALGLGGDVLGGGDILPEPDGVITDGLGMLDDVLGGASTGGGGGGLLGGGLGGLFG